METVRLSFFLKIKPAYNIDEIQKKKCYKYKNPLLRIAFIYLSDTCALFISTHKTWGEDLKEKKRTLHFSCLLST